MDAISVLGLLIGLAAIVVGQVLEGGHLASLIQPTAFLIVMGGTLGAVMLQSPVTIFIDGVKMLKWVFLPPNLQPQRMIDEVVQWAIIARKEGLLALENRLDIIPDRFMQKGVELLVDGIEPDQLRELMEIEIDAYAAQRKKGAKVWESAGGYAPTIGILGAVMGLIHVMENLSDPSKLGEGIAVAFVATIYGVGSANLLFLPMSKKIITYVDAICASREMLVEGLAGIANGDNPRMIEGRMRSYLVS